MSVRTETDLASLVPVEGVAEEKTETATPYFDHTTKRFLARDSMLSALYAIANPSVRLSVCLSVRLSVCHTGGSVKNG